MKTVTHIKSTEERCFVLASATVVIVLCRSFNVFVCHLDGSFFDVKKQKTFHTHTVALVIYLKSGKFLHHFGQIVPILIDRLARDSCRYGR